MIELGGSILQSWTWGEFQRSLGNKIYRFLGSDFAVLAFEESLPFGKRYLYCPRGPLGNLESALQDLNSLQADKNLIFCRIEPGQISNADSQLRTLKKSEKDIQPANIWLLSLEQSEEEILIRMKPKSRYNINLAQRKKVEVWEGGRQDLIVFWKLILETSKRNNFRLHPQDYYFKMWEHLSPTNLKLMLAKVNGEVVAGMLLTLYSDTATYLHGGSTSRFKEAMAPYLLHWEAIKLAKKSGLKFYDFGGIAPKGAENHSWAGISRFKKSFGGFEVNYPGSFDLVYSPIWYNAYKHARSLRNILKVTRNK